MNYILTKKSWNPFYYGFLVERRHAERVQVRNSTSTTRLQYKETHSLETRNMFSEGILKLLTKTYRFTWVNQKKQDGKQTKTYPLSYHDQEGAKRRHSSFFPSDYIMDSCTSANELMEEQSSLTVLKERDEFAHSNKNKS